MVNSVWLIVLVAALLTGCSRHPKDAELQATFQTNIQTLSKIVRELKLQREVERIDWENGILVVNSSQTNPPALTAKLFPLFSSLGPKLLVTNARDGSQTLFYFSNQGLSVSGSSKGISYRENIPDRLVQDTDKASRTNASFTVFRPLQTNWFIFYSR